MLGKFNLLLMLGLLSVCSVASADPIVIGGFVISWMTVAQVVVIAYSVYGAAQQRKAAKAAAAKARADYNAGLQDRTATIVSTESPHRIIYGEARVGSTVVAMFTSGAKDEYKHLVCVHAAHECESIGEIYVAGEALGPLNASGDVTSGKYSSSRTENTIEGFTGATHALSYTPIAGTISVYSTADQTSHDAVPFTYSAGTNTVTFDNTGTYSAFVSYQYTVTTSRVNVKKHLGGPTDPADASLMAALPSYWPSTATLRGFCYTVVRLDLNQPEFQSGLPTIEVVIKGKKLYDPRDGVTRWSDNPPLATYDYLTSDICGVPASDLPVAQYITAANACDEVISVGKRYTINGTVTSDQSQSQVLEAMAQCMAGSIVSTTWDIYAGKYVAPVMALNQADIVGNIAITPGISDADLYNGVKGQYIGAENLWVSTDYKPYQNPTYAAVDGRDLWNSIDMSFTNTVQRVHNLCRIFVEDQRNGFTIKADFSLKAWGLKVGQRITFTSEFFGQTSKVYRITDKKFSPSSAIELTLKEDAASIWDEADAVVVDATPNTNLPNPFFVAKIASLTCVSGSEALFLQSDGTVVSRILVTWPIATIQSVVDSGFLEIQWQAIGSNVWETQQITGVNTQTYINGVTDGSYYNVRIRAINPTLNVKSDWEYADVHQVVGKTEPPADVPWFSIEGNTLSWGDVPDLDLAGYEIRYHYGSNTSWGDAAPLHTGLLTQGPYTPDNLPQGRITLMICSVDTSGNVSSTTARIETQLGDVLVANVIETLDFKALAYPGTLNGCSIVGGSVVADGTLNFFKANTITTGGGFGGPARRTQSTLFFRELSESSFYNDYYSEMSYETYEVTPPYVGGSNLTLGTDVSGDSIFIQYRTSGLAPLYDVDPATDFYHVDTDTFYSPMPSEYQSWPGQVAAAPVQYQFRFSIGQGITQGVIDDCNVVIDVPDRVEIVNSYVISNTGSRLPLGSPFNTIQNVQLTLEADGNGATTVEIIDKSSTLGPLIYCRNSAGALVAGMVDAVIQGY